MTAISGDRLLVTVARRGWGWLSVLGVAGTAGTAAQLLLPAAIGRAVDAAIAQAGTITGHGTVSRSGPLALSSTESWLLGCAALIAVIACTEVAASLATGMSGAAATARLRETLGAYVLVAGHRLGRRSASRPAGATNPAGAPKPGSAASSPNPGNPNPGDPGNPGSASSAADTFGPGDIVARLVGGAADAGVGPASVVTSIAAAIPPVGSVVALGLIDPWLAVAFLAGFPVLAVMMRRLARDAATIGTGYGQAQGAIAGRLLDALAGARTIAAAGTQSRERHRILAPIADLREHGYASWRVQARAAAQGMLIAPLLQVIVIAVAGVELAHHRITPGDLLAASQYATLAVGIGASTSMVARLGRARGGARRAAGLLAAPLPRYGSAVPEAPSGRRYPGELRLRGVTVRRGGEAVLNGLDLTVPGGSCVAIVGRSGAGKSTLAEIAGRLTDPDEGSVILDATDLRDLTRASLRTAVVYAFERPHLFGRTPREAITFGAGPPPTARALAIAAQDSQAAAFITRLPEKYDTPMDGAPLSWATFSGGEVQRLGLARAFAHAAAARLLILDDATSSLDTVTEMLVSQAITGRLRGRTRLVIAHRAATAARADLVAWLDGGQIRALAPHDRLWANPDYQALFGSAPNGTAPADTARADIAPTGTA